jgi:hypothetical protein
MKVPANFQEQSHVVGDISAVSTPTVQVSGLQPEPTTQVINAPAPAPMTGDTAVTAGGQVASPWQWPGDSATAQITG